MTSRIYNHGPFEFESGPTLPNLKLSYRIHGSNDNKDKVILIPTWYGGTSEDMDVYIGPSRAINSNKYFIIIVDQIGNGESSSPNNTKAPYDAINFPDVHISDDVKAQKALLDELGISTLALVFGGSMGGMQTYEWAVRFPQMVERAAVLGAYAKTSDHCAQLPKLLERALVLDPEYNGGMYKRREDVRGGLELHYMIIARVGFSPQFYRNRRYRDIEDMGQDNAEDFEQNFADSLCSKMDPNNLICMARKWQHADVSRGYDSLEEALARVTAKMLIVPIIQDEMFLREEIKMEQALLPNSILREVRSELGHIAIHSHESSFEHDFDEHVEELMAFEV